MSRPLDLLLLTDEPIEWEGNYWAQSWQKIEREMRNCGITSSDKEATENEHGVREYFRPLKPLSDGNGKMPHHGDWRIRVPHRPHLSLTDLATVATARGYGVSIVDNVTRYPSRTAQVQAIIDEKPRAIAISTTFLLTQAVVEKFVGMIREMAPETKIILGGPTVRKVEELHGLADFAVFGDGEDPLLGVMEVLDGTRDPATVPRIAYKTDDGGVAYGSHGREAGHVGVNGKAFKAFDVPIPIADWTLANRSYANAFPIEFSRGCKYNCFYCSFDRGKNIRPLEEVREELVRNAALGLTKYRVSDSNFTDGPPRYKAYPHDVCRLMIELDLGLQWSCYARVDDLASPGLTDLMAQAGCFAVFLGLESGSDAILKKMRKGHNREDALNGVRIAKEAGIRTHGSFVVGYPGETRETFEDTLEFIIESRPDTVNLGQYRLEHDTPAYGVADFELEGLGMEWRHKTMDSGEADVLVLEGNRRLLEAGICLNTELSLPTFMGLGLTLEGSMQLMDDMDLVGQDSSPDETKYAQARDRMRHTLLDTFPRAIAKDQQMWNSGAV